MTRKTSNRFSPEVRQRAVRMALEHGGDHASQWAAAGPLAGAPGPPAGTPRGGRGRGGGMALERGGPHASQWAAIGSIAGTIGCTAETPRRWVRQAERDR